MCDELAMGSRGGTGAFSVTRMRSQVWAIFAQRAMQDAVGFAGRAVSFVVVGMLRMQFSSRRSAGFAVVHLSQSSWVREEARWVFGVRLWRRIDEVAGLWAACIWKGNF